MKKAFKFIALSTLIAASGCTSYNISQPAAPIDSQVKADLKADVAVGEAISGQSSVNILFGVLKFGGDNQFADGVTYGGDTGGGLGMLDPVSAVKSAAAYKAVKASGADLIVAPRYEVSEENYFVFKKVSVTVKGNKGSIRSIQ
ncbi:hypothetical protein ACTJKT_08180 [Pseudomonas sp. 22526]|uniref:Lipoprotein n=1 Tax=Pseudomonas chlororaphis TaxID=587753 RepID=A0AAX3G2F1_9PSED|nr:MULTISPECIES: hypothetical protein [Pseudomonas]AZC36339.1 hypothetical protein C4K37_1942 [Pseudomonas chlororaphis subsp. piscium]AZC42885.1 hypothetical protein C4K36_1950 [Pseudomonas chlororaphis subsp. piscium]AZC49528.1 hypothetical protein C4K35_1935 [Pseudomonas chlororaphis subsp. piscium]AZC56109.1 hypothetical protein C4K34_1934 [Pseudomonas chlororaphis subsp. piscium]AZC62367.1 hypothetical protein C4K33_1865 [Pseudomonas chlororaphis subsp. piscium]